MKSKKKLVFLTGTRADFGKIKPLILSLSKSKDFEVHIFVTGMHVSARYGYTVDEIKKSKLPNIYQFDNNAESDKQDLILAHTIIGFSSYLKIIQPDMIVIHGDRVEALAGSIAGSVNNVLVSHIEGGELSGSIDDSIRHSISKMSHVHFVANTLARRRLIQMGENNKSVFVIGSPDLDVMSSKDLPTLSETKKRYEIDFDNYGILVCHPVTTQQTGTREETAILLDAILESELNFVMIHPNNDPGADVIYDLIRERFFDNNRFRIFPSVRFEHFLTLIKNALFLIGNSSAGIRETPFYGVPSINVGSRQNGRISSRAASSVFDCEYDKKKILALIRRFGAKPIRFSKSRHFGNGRSVNKFLKIIERASFWKIKIQKQFSDIIF